MELPSELRVVRDGSAPAVSASPGAQGCSDTAFESWVADAGTDLMRFAQATTRGLDPADLVQEALVAVFTRWSRLDRAGQAEAYARRVIVNAHVSRWRRWGRRVTVVDAMPLTAALADHADGSDEVLATRRLLATLPVTYRAAVFLRFYDDLAYAQIADVLGCREATARSYVHRALAQLKNHLDQESTDD